MAAAPDMLEALEWACSQLCQYPTWCEANHPVRKPKHDAIRATIAKAMGETECPSTHRGLGAQGNPHLTPEEASFPSKGCQLASFSQDSLLGRPHRNLSVDVLDTVAPAANARLIAAAPDMEKALEKIVLEFEGYASDGLDLAIAAIAKARGE